MERYFVFDIAEPLGGMRDFIISYPLLEDAKKFRNNHTRPADIQIWDTLTNDDVTHEEDD